MMTLEEVSGFQPAPYMTKIRIQGKPFFGHNMADSFYNYFHTLCVAQHGLCTLPFLLPMPMQVLLMCTHLCVLYVQLINDAHRQM